MPNEADALARQYVKEAARMMRLTEASIRCNRGTESQQWYACIEAAQAIDTLVDAFPGLRDEILGERIQSV